MKQIETKKNAVKLTKALEDYEISKEMEENSVHRGYKKHVIINKKASGKS